MCIGYLKPLTHSQLAFISNLLSSFFGCCCPDGTQVSVSVPAFPSCSGLSSGRSSLDRRARGERTTHSHGLLAPYSLTHIPTPTPHPTRGLPSHSHSHSHSLGAARLVSSCFPYSHLPLPLLNSTSTKPNLDYGPTLYPPPLFSEKVYPLSRRLSLLPLFRLLMITAS